MTDFFSGSTFFAVTLTLLVWRITSLIQKKTGSALLNPILMSAAVIIPFLLLLKIPNRVYQEGMKPLSFLLTPATVCLALPLYEQMKVLKKNLPAIALGVLSGTLATLACVGGLCLLFRTEHRMTVSLLTKSVTTAIGVPVSEAAGGLGSVAAAVIVVTGILGNVLGTALCRLFHISDPIAQGAAIGTTSHVIGTAKANEMGRIQGAVSSLSLVTAGVQTAFLVPLINSMIS